MVRMGLVLLMLVAGCSGNVAAEFPPEPPEGAAELRELQRLLDDGGTMVLESPAFPDLGVLPAEFGCDGISPPLRWSGVPEEAAELWLTLTEVVDPGGARTNWAVSGIDPDSSEVDGGEVPPGGTEQTNSFGGTGYRGPCPGEGDSHRYVFRLESISSSGDFLDSASLIVSVP